MPIWMPLTPPLSDGAYQDEFDIYVDDTFDLIYELDPLNESRLPSTIYELHKPFIKPSSPQKQVHHHSGSSQYDLTDADRSHQTSGVNASGPYKASATATIDKSEFDIYGIDEFETRKSEVHESKSRRERQRPQAARSNEQTRRMEALPAAPPPHPEREELDYEGPEWTILEDLELLNAVKAEEEKGHQLHKTKESGLMFNWEIIAYLVNRVSHFYRSPRQCSIRYQLSIRTREQGIVVAFDPVTQKQRKVNVSQVELSHMRKGRVTTQQMYDHDANRIQSNKWINRFKLIKQQMARHMSAFRRGPFDENIVKSVQGVLVPEQMTKMSSLCVDYHNPMALADIIKTQEEKAYTHIVQQTEKRKADKVPSEERPPSPLPFFLLPRKCAVPKDAKGVVIERHPLFMEMLPICPPVTFPPSQQMQAQGAARMNIQGQGHSQGAPVTSQQQPGGNQQQITQDGQPLPRRAPPSSSQASMGSAVSQPSTSSAPHGYVVVTGGQVSTAGAEIQQAQRVQQVPSRSSDSGSSQSGAMPPTTQAVYRSLGSSQLGANQQVGQNQMTAIIQQVKRTQGSTATTMHVQRGPVGYMATGATQQQGQSQGQNVYSQVIVQQSRGATATGPGQGEPIRRPVQRVAGAPGRMYASGDRFMMSSSGQQAAGGSGTPSQMRLVPSGQRIVAGGQQSGANQGQQIQIAQGGSGQTVQAPKRMQPGGQITSGMLLQRPGAAQQAGTQQIRSNTIQGRYTQPRIMVTNTGAAGQIRQTVQQPQGTTMRQILSRPMGGSTGQMVARGSGGSPQTQTVAQVLLAPPTTSSEGGTSTSQPSSVGPPTSSVSSSASSPLSGPPQLQPQVIHQGKSSGAPQQDGAGSGQ
ncbi:hypothetical protein WR25_20291 [Diploscapter pachys]|uniref:Myb-like domain-containing protein n=1 Tax=Diploscapter pachys TaxID=2018661 RepID=A0A2A2LPI0_9BILA|nr:hypothetical protein WR25_20291 [Diploscapter pachys]